MGNKLGCHKRSGDAADAAAAPAADPHALAKSDSRRSNASASNGSGGPRPSLSLSRLSVQLRRASSRVLGFRSHAAAANARHQLEARLAEVIAAKAQQGSGRPKVKVRGRGGTDTQASGWSACACPASAMLPPLQAPAPRATHSPPTLAGPLQFNRLLLRFGSLSEGFAACRAVFKQLAGSEEGELSLDQLRQACSTLG